MNREQLKHQIVNNFENAEITEKERLINIMQCIDEHIKQLRIGGVSNSLLELQKYSIDEIENYLDTIGYSIIKTTELDYLEEKLMNHPC